MILCLVLFVILIVCRKRIPDKKIFYIMFFCNLAAFFLFLIAQVRSGELETVQRGTYGEGPRKETYLVSVEGEMEEQEVTVEIEEQLYTKERVQEMFSEVMDELEWVILGENESKDSITKDMLLPTEVEGYPVQIRWEMDRYDVIGSCGELIAENLKKEGTLVELRGLLTYQDYEAVYVTTVNVFSEEKTGNERWIFDIQTLFQKEEEASREEAQVDLPQVVSGKKVSWREKKEDKGYVILGFGMVVSSLLVFQKYQDIREAEEKRRRQMEMDYPEIISSFAMLLGTGMTVKNTWNKIVQTYEEEKKSGKNRFAYEEMCLTSREMQSGISEQEAYERFGKRCKWSSYTKFSMLLSQNLRKGSKGLSELLKMESVQAMEMRKQQAKKRGEEVSTKLLLPMSLMFVVVLAIVMIPAFLSMKI